MSYTFKPGERTKFKTWDDYVSRKLDPWTWLIINSIDDGYARISLAEAPGAIEEPVPVDLLEPPLGFKDVYTIIANSPEQAEFIWSWLKTRSGIAVFVCLDLSQAGRMQYMPAVSKEGVKVTPEYKPHWSMGFVEIVEDPARIKIQVELVEYSKPKDKKGWTYDKHQYCWWKWEDWSPESKP